MATRVTLSLIVKNEGNTLASGWRRFSRGPTSSAEAEGLSRAAVAEAPLFIPARMGLGELYLGQGRWKELEEALSHLPDAVPWSVEAAVLRARAHPARREFAAARPLLLPRRGLGRASCAWPGSAGPSWTG